MKIILEKVCEAFKRQPKLEGIILYGSYAMGKSHSQSDIDLVVIYDKPIDQVHCFKEGNTLIHVLERSFSVFKERLFKQTRIVPYFYNAVVLYDKTGQIEQYIQEAIKTAHIKGPKPLAETEILQKRITLSQDIYTIEGLIEQDNFEGATLVIHEVLTVALDLYYNHHHYYKVSEKHIIDDLKLRDERLAELASLVILSTDIRAKLANLWIIRNEIIDLLGGEKLEYTIEF